MILSARTAVLVAIVLTLIGCGDRGDYSADVDQRLRALEAQVAAIAKERKDVAPAMAASTSMPVVAPSASTDAARRTLDALQAQPMSVDFENADVGMVLKLIFDQADVNRVLSAAAAAVHTPVTVKLDRSNAHDALDSIAAATSLRWAVDRAGIVRITTAEEAVTR